MRKPAKDNYNETIPCDLQFAAASIATICRRYGLSSVKATLRSGESYESVELNWTQGRHGIERDTARLSYSKDITVDIDALVESPEPEAS